MWLFCLTDFWFLIRLSDFIWNTVDSEWIQDEFACFHLSLQNNIMVQEWLLAVLHWSFEFKQNHEWRFFVSVAPGHGNITSFVETVVMVRSTPLLPQRTPESKVFENKRTEKKEKAWWAKEIMKKGRAQKLTFAPCLPFLFHFLSPTLCFSTCSFLLSYQRLFVSGPDLTPRQCP